MCHFVKILFHMIPPQNLHITLPLLFQTLTSHSSYLTFIDGDVSVSCRENSLMHMEGEILQDIVDERQIGHGGLTYRVLKGLTMSMGGLTHHLSGKTVALIPYNIQKSTDHHRSNRVVFSRANSPRAIVFCGIKKWRWSQPYRTNTCRKNPSTRGKCQKLFAQ